jgi:hypothetical protein
MTGPKDRVAALLAVTVVVSCAGWLTGRGSADDPTSSARPQTPTDSQLPPESRPSFGPVIRDWVRTVAYLLPDENDPPNSFRVVEPQERDPGVKNYYKEVCYAPKGEKKPRRILRFFPNGAPCTIIDNIGDEQFCRCLHPDGTVSVYTHWRKGRWVGGHSISPDGKRVHRLARGTGELVFYGREAGNYVHRWYYEGDNFLSKRHQNGSFTMIRLNGEKDWFLVRKTGEDLLLFSKNETWHRPAGGAPVVQALDQAPPRIERRPKPGVGVEADRIYASRRRAFVDEIGRLLDKAGYTWRELGIDFIRTGAAWPY